MAPVWSQGLLSFVLLLSLVLPSHALYWYMDGHSPKCFFEELPKDTLVVGHYEVQQFNPTTRVYETDNNIRLTLTVEEVFDQHHRIVNQEGASKAKFTFSAADSGEHKLCFTPRNVQHHQGYLLNGSGVGGVKIILDMAIGETSKIESTDKGKIDDIVGKVKDLSGRLLDIRREQVFMREREAEFRDQSEATNSRVVRWTLIQLAILGVTCAWQLTHLRAFFIKQKLT